MSSVIILITDPFHHSSLSSLTSSSQIIVVAYHCHPLSCLSLFRSSLIIVYNCHTDPFHYHCHHCSSSSLIIVITFHCHQCGRRGAFYAFVRGRGTHCPPWGAKTLFLFSVAGVASVSIGCLLCGGCGIFDCFVALVVLLRW